jgi:integrase
LPEEEHITMARRQYKRLTVNELPEKARTPGLHCDGDGLNLAVGKNLTASWVLRFIDHEGKARTMGLGSLQRVSLAEARRKAAAAHARHDAGYDPIEDRHERRTARKVKAAKQKTFQQCAELWIATHQEGWNAVHRRQVPNTFKAYAYPVIGKLPVAAIDTALVMQVLEQNAAPEGAEPKSFWLAKTPTASRVRERIEAVLDYATSREFRHGENPARWKGHLENLLPKPSAIRAVKHLPAMAHKDLPDFMAELRARQQDVVVESATEFAILTCARTSAVLGMTWDEYDPVERSWEVKEERQRKGKRQHRMALSDAAVAVLDRMKAISGNGEYVFPSPRKPGASIGEEAMLDLLRKMGRSCTTHGFRSTFSTWCVERTTVPVEMREMQLGHRVGNDVLLSYMRSDMFQRRRDLLRMWSEHCAGLLPYDEAEDTAGKVIPIRARG